MSTAQETPARRTNRVPAEERARLQREAVAAYTGDGGVRPLPLEEIARQLGRSYGYVRKLIIDADVKLRGRGVSGRVPDTDGEAGA